MFASISSFLGTPIPTRQASQKAHEHQPQHEMER
jgi:hypothetical protein